MKLTIAMVLFTGAAIGLLEAGLQTSFHWVSHFGFGLLSVATVLLLTDMYVSVVVSFKMDESHGA